MKTKWDQLLEQFIEASTGTRPWLSDIKHFRQMVKIAQDWNLEFPYTEEVSITKLRIILPEARRAIKTRDKNRLVELLQWTSALSSRDLKLKLGIPFLETIEFKRVIKEEEGPYFIQVSKEQLEALKKTARLNFEFVEVEG